MNITEKKIKWDEHIRRISPFRLVRIGTDGMPGNPFRKWSDSLFDRTSCVFLLSPYE